MNDPDPNSLADIETEIRRIMRQCHTVTDEVKERGQRAAEAERDYKVKFAQTMLQAEGPMDLRKATAEVACADELLEYKMSANLFVSARDASETHRRRLEAARTMCANIRALVGGATGFGG
jgi:hypothetical protein